MWLALIAVVLPVALVAAPPASAYPPGTLATASINSTAFRPGDTVVVTTQNVTPRAVLTMTVGSPPVVIGSGVKVPRNGSAAITGTMPSNLPGGSTNVTVSATTGETFVFDVTLLGGNDHTPPGPVTGLTATPGPSNVTLRWALPADDDVRQIIVTRAPGDAIALDAETTRFTDPGLVSGTEYSWSVYAVDFAGNASTSADVVATAGAGAMTTATWGLPRLVDNRQGQPTSVSCPTVDFCAAADQLGSVVARPSRQWGTPVQIASGYPAGGVDCVSATYCLAAGGGLWSVWNGTQWSAPASGPFPAYGVRVSCGTKTCVGVSDDRAATFDGRTWSTPTTVDPGGQLQDVSCAGKANCVAIDYGGNAVRFDGTSWTAPAPVENGLQLTAVSCFSAVFCVATDTRRGSVVFDGATWSAPTLLPSSATYTLTSISCPSVRMCMATDGYSAFRYNGRTWSRGTPVVVQSALRAISCATTTSCTAVDQDGKSYDYDGSSWSAPIVFDPLQLGLRRMACATGDFCAAAEDFGRVLTGRGGDLIVTATDRQFLDLACASATACFGLEVDGVSRFDGASWSAPTQVDDQQLLRVSCATATTCTAVDVAGRSTRWNGTAWTAPVTIPGFQSPVRDLDCWGATSCRAVDARGWVSTGGATRWTTPLDPGLSLSAISCVSTSFCVATSGNATTLTFDGTTWSINSPKVGYGYISGLDCATGRFCAAVTSYGLTTVFDGTFWSLPVQTEDDGAFPMDLACTSTSFCAIVDQLGNVLTGRRS